ncbi:MAG TPA: TIGR00730 family Rossman fold protein, partial [Ilumatobacteraceae bacterium]|nr:TIGR00730 family Rossman fold protein [Ilumatobacteraceae bacterium]
PVYLEAARLLGAAIAEHGHQLVYGGGHVGLMGVVADAALAGGGSVLGVMTEQLVAAEVAHLGLTELQITPTMHARKARMAELSDGVIVLPGGFGTLDEAFEIITWNQLGLVAVPVVFLDVADYFAPLFAFIDSTVVTGFVSSANAAIARRASTVEHAVDLARSRPDPFTPKWLG